MILMIHGGPQALLTTSYWTAAHVETGCMCLCVSRPPYCSVSWWPKVGSLTIKWRNCCFEVTTVCSGGRVNFSHQRENQSTLVSYWRFSPAAVCWLCTSSSHADNECPNIWRPNTGWSSGDQTVNILGKLRKTKTKNLWVTLILTTTSPCKD